jgi:hypothetical protein
VQRQPELWSRELQQSKWQLREQPPGLLPPEPQQVQQQQEQLSELLPLEFQS